MKRIVIRRGKSRKSGLRLSRVWKVFTVQSGVLRSRESWFVDVYPGRLAAMLVVLGIACYFAGTVALYVFWNKRPHNQITYLDVVLPTRWSDIRPKQGQMLIAYADEMLQEKKIREAFHMLRTGLRLYPQDQDARLTLASIMISAGMTNQAGKLLLDGLQYGYPENSNYLAALFQIVKHQEDLDLLTLSLPVLLRYTEVSEDDERKYSLLRQLMFAQLATGKHLELLATAERVNTDDNSPYKAHDMIVTAHVGMGNPQVARDYLEGLEAGYRNIPSMMLIEATLYNELDDRAAMLAVIERLFRSQPTAWPQQTQAILLLARTGEDRWARAYLDLYLSKFRQNKDAIQRLGAALTDMPSSALIESMMKNLVVDHPGYGPSMKFFLAQALITEGRFAEARPVFDEVRPALLSDPENEINVAIFDLILRAAIERGQGSQATLINALREHRYVAEIYWEAALAMQQSGQTQAAREIINYGLTLYPSQPALQELRRQIVEGGDQLNRQRQALAGGDPLMDGVY